MGVLGDFTAWCEAPADPAERTRRRRLREAAERLADPHRAESPAGGVLAVLSARVPGFAEAEYRAALEHAFLGLR